MDEDKFRKFATGKMKLTIEGEPFEIIMKVSERLPVLNLLGANSKAIVGGINPSKILVEDARLAIISAFVNSYPSVGRDVIESFVDKTFEQLIGEISIASGWVTKEQITAAAEKAFDKKKQ